MINFNRLGVINNPYQRLDEFKRVVTLCSAGCLRSPTAAVVLSQDPYNYNTRAAGLSEEYAIIPFDEGLYHWADEIVVMQPHMEHKVIRLCQEFNKEDVVPIICLNIPDNYPYRDPELIELIKERYDAALKERSYE